MCVWVWSRWTKSWHTNIRICVQRPMCIYMLRGGMRSWTNCLFCLTYFFFRKRKAKDVNANHRSSQILIPRFERIDPESRVLNYFLFNKSNHHHTMRKRYREAKKHRMPYVFRSFSVKRTLSLVALLRKMTCNLRHPIGLRHPVERFTR